ncbi:MAG: response regulator [Alcanivoracaceae bacterium]|nr:response regulator [Alcanivoracaceae bacterium]
MRNRLSRPDTAAWFVCLLLLAGATRAAPPAYLVDSSQARDRITVYADFLADPGGQLTLNDIRTTPDSAFTPASGSRERIGFTRDVIWVRLALKNTSDAPLRRFLNLIPGLFRQTTLFFPSEQGYQQRLAGNDLSPPWADIPARHQVFDLTLPPDQVEVYYLRIQPALAANFSIVLADALNQPLISRGDDLALLVLGGIVIGLMLFNLGLWVSSRQPANLYYSAFQLCLLLTCLVSSGFIGVRFIPMPGFQSITEIMLEFAAVVLSAQFTRHFLNLKATLPWLDRGLRLLSGSAVLLALMCLALPTYIAGMLAYGMLFLSSIVFVFVGFRALSQQVAQARLYLAARATLVGSVMLAILAGFGVLPLDVHLPLLILAAGAVEAVLFAAGLTVLREIQMRRDFQRSQQQAMEELTWQTRNDTLSRVSHEIRTPMSGILGMAELLTDTPLTPNQKECVRSIRSAGENLLRVINDVLEYSRLEQGDANVNRDQFDLSEVVMDAMDLFRERAEEKRMELIAHIHTNVPTRVEGDPNKLRQTLTNILGTCIREGMEGEIVVDVSRDTSGRANHIRFELEGSALQHCGDFLAPLIRSTTGNQEDGTSLSLSIARQLTEAMNGDCGLRESRRQGTVCWISLPLPAAASDETTEPTDPGILLGRSMLVVDDSSTVTRVIRQQALNWGMRVTVSLDPREALASIRTQANLGEPYDIVLLDHHMPGISGMQLAARIHEDPVITHPLVLVMLTGVQDAPTATNARNVGIHKVLSKPVSGPRLKQALSEAMGMITPRSDDAADGIMPDPGLRILVAEDHLLSQKVIRGMLAKLNLEPDVVSNGAEAVEAIQKTDYDLVLMDCEMPQMDGFEATRRIRDWERMHGRRPLPIIALTAHILREHKERSMASGMNAHVAKPVELGALAEVIVRFTRPAAGGPAPETPHANAGKPE